MPTSSTVLLTAILLAVTGCVSRGKYDKALADAQKARADLIRADAANDATDRRLAKSQAKVAELEKFMHDAEARCTHTARELETSQADAVSCSKALDEATAMNQQLRGELERLGKNVDQLLSAKGALASSLDNAKARLEELRRAQAAAEARTALFRNLALRFRRMVDAGDLQIVLRRGRMVLVLSNDVLFDSGKTEIKPRGKEALSQVGAVLATVKDRQFQVAGHTDNEPIRRSSFESNWELSTARALQVVEFLIGAGMQPETLSAAGYGEFDPVQPNDTAQHKAKNRRIEITLQPNIDELVTVPDPR